MLDSGAKRDYNGKYMAKDIKLTLHKNHREAIEKLKERTGLSFNQIINLVWVKSADIRLDIQANHSAEK